MKNPTRTFVALFLAVSAAASSAGAASLTGIEADGEMLVLKLDGPAAYTTGRTAAQHKLVVDLQGVNGPGMRFLKGTSGFVSARVRTYKGSDGDATRVFVKLPKAAGYAVARRGNDLAISFPAGAEEMPQAAPIPAPKPIMIPTPAAMPVAVAPKPAPPAAKPAEAAGAILTGISAIEDVVELRITGTIAHKAAYAPNPARIVITLSGTTTLPQERTPASSSKIVKNVSSRREGDATIVEVFLTAPKSYSVEKKDGLLRVGFNQ